MHRSQTSACSDITDQNPVIQALPSRLLCDYHEEHIQSPYKASQYETLCHIMPYTLRAKTLRQHLCDKKRDWNDPKLPEDLLCL